MQPSPCKILVVDDEPLLRTLFLRNFDERIESHELQFYFASNGVEALEILEKEKDIGIVITDIKMPVMNGLDLLKRLADQDRVYRSAVVTAYGDMKNIREAMSLGVSDFITKPFDFKDLDQSLTKIITQYNEYIKSDQEKLEAASLQKELMIAHEIQGMLSPKDFNPLPAFSKGFDIYGKIYPAEEMSGAFIDFFPIDKEKLSFCVGSASGKGIPASLFMAMSMTLIKGFVSSKVPLTQCLHQANTLLCQHNKSNMSVSILLGALNLQQGDLTFCNAGSALTLVISEDGTIRALSAHSEKPLGIEEVNYHDSHIKLQKNDLLFFSTPAIIEASNPQKELFGEERLKKYLTKTAATPLSEIIEGLKKEIDQFLGGSPQTGDIAIMLLRYRGNA